MTQAIELLKQAKPLFEGGSGYALAAIGAISAVLGALATFFPSYWIETSRSRQLRRSVAAQLYAEINAIRQIERHRGYIRDIRKIVSEFDAGSTQPRVYQVQFSDERFHIYRSCVPHLALLDPKLQSKIVLLYQLLEAVVQDMKPGGLLNAKAVGRKPFDEILQVLNSARETADEVLAALESQFPNLREEL